MRLAASLGALFCGLAVLLGAFGAHMLKGSISAERLETFQTGVQYQFGHGLALLLLAAIWDRLACPHRAAVTTWLFTTGIVLFSGSLYVIAISGVRGFGMVAPVGGLAMMVGWTVFGVNVFRRG